MIIQPGDKMLFCVGVGRDRQFYSFEAQAGRAAVMVLGGGVPAVALDPFVTALASRRAALAALAADLLVLQGFSAGPAAFQPRPGVNPDVPVILCPDAYFSKCETDGTALVVVIDRAARVAARWLLADNSPADLAAAAEAALANLAREPARVCVLPAPVLGIPGIFDAKLCQAIMEAFEIAPNFDSLVSGVDREGRPHHRLDPTRKRRRDWLLEPGDPLYAQVQSLILRRCAPEIRLAFQKEVSHLDRVLVARYDDSGGYFGRHRDNTAPAVAFRQFALSVNLNAGGYDGGELSFPEYNDHRYSPGTGEGLAFSASLLHEARPVTRGRRYVLLTFLHDAQAEQARLATAGT